MRTPLRLAHLLSLCIMLPAFNSAFAQTLEPLNGSALNIRNAAYGDTYFPFGPNGVAYVSGTHFIYRSFNNNTHQEHFIIDGGTGNVGIGGLWPNSMLSLGRGTADSKLALHDVANDKYGFGIRNGQLRLHIGNPSAKFTFLNSEAGSEIMTVYGNGSVIIGTIPENTPPPSNGFLLTVKGKVLASEVKVSVAALGDYIFSPAYRLRPLSEVEAYVKQNGHLPEVPSAAEVAKEGMNVGEMENTLLKKVEELTLYVIELKKENDQQAQQIEQLRKGKNKR